MNDTTKKTMTLEEVSTELLEYEELAETPNEKRGYRRMREAIDAHLSAQRELLPIGNADYIPPVEDVEFLHVDNLSHSAQRKGEAVAWRHNRTHCLYETKDDVPLADGDEWAEPLYTAPPTPRVEVTEEMVNRACQAFFVGNVRKPWPWRETQDMDEPDAVFAQMRAALEAALSEKGHG
jgi:hypothetical protein